MDIWFSRTISILIFLANEKQIEYFGKSSRQVYFYIVNYNNYMGNE